MAARALHDEPRSVVEDQAAAGDGALGLGELGEVDGGNAAAGPLEAGGGGGLSHAAAVQPLIKSQCRDRLCRCTLWWLGVAGDHIAFRVVPRARVRALVLATV